MNTTAEKNTILTNGYKLNKELPLPYIGLIDEYENGIRNNFYS